MLCGITIKFMPGYRHIKFNKVPEEFDFDQMVDENYQFNRNKKMNGIFTMTWGEVFRAIIIAVIVAVGSYVLGVGDVWSLDWHVLTNNAVLAGVASVLTSLGTTKKGNFVGAVPVE